MVTAVARAGRAVRAALEKYAPGDVGRFEAELRTALSRAGDDLDLAGVDAVLGRWHALAAMAADPLTEAERAQVQRAKSGDFAGLYTRNEQGDWVQL